MRSAAVAMKSAVVVCAIAVSALADDQRSGQGKRPQIFENLIRPRVHIVTLPPFVVRSPEGAESQPSWALVEILGLSVTWKPIDLESSNNWVDGVPEDDDGLVVHGRLPTIQTCGAFMGLVRCEMHSAETFRQRYSVGPDALEVAEEVGKADGFFVIHDWPQVLVGSALRSNSADPDDLDHAAHVALARRARALRIGKYVYPRCNELCSPEFSVHRNHFDLPWLLSPIYGGRLPPHLSIVNLGCRDFGAGDPLFSLLASGVHLTGLCVEADPAFTAAAEQQLQGHDVRVVQAFLTPDAVSRMLEEHVGEALDVLKVDIDSFDAYVLHAALSVTRPNVVIAEYQFQVPPPFLFAKHYEGEDELPDDYADVFGGLHGASLSYLVDLLASRGFLLYKMNELDAMWVREDVAGRLLQTDHDLDFPIDEWACYLQTPFYMGDDRVKFPIDFVRDWVLDGDTHRAMRRIWRNITELNPHQSFTLDLARPSARVE